MGCPFWGGSKKGLKGTWGRGVKNVDFLGDVLYGCSLKTVLIHSFIIHYGDFYSASSRLLFRSAPEPCTAKNKSFQARVECVGKNHGEQSLCQRKPFPHCGANY